jgi:hypothetical protein
LNELARVVLVGDRSLVLHDVGVKLLLEDFALSLGSIPDMLDIFVEAFKNWKLFEYVIFDCKIVTLHVLDAVTQVVDALLDKRLEKLWIVHWPRISSKFFFNITIFN